MNRLLGQSQAEGRMLRELIVKPVFRRSRTCESCGEDFDCEIGLKGCWCTSVELTAEERTAIAEKYSDCLCRKCLEAASGNAASPAQLP